MPLGKLRRIDASTEYWKWCDAYSALQILLTETGFQRGYPWNIWVIAVCGLLEFIPDPVTSALWVNAGMSKTMNLYLITSLEFLCPVEKVCPCSLTPLSLKGKEKKHFLFVKLLACVNVQYDCSIGATVYFQVCLWDFSFPLDLHVECCLFSLLT